MFPAVSSDEPVLICSQCGTKMDIKEFVYGTGRGFADAYCQTCRTLWRYIRTPATGWERAINLTRHYTYRYVPEYHQATLF